MPTQPHPRDRERTPPAPHDEPVSVDEALLTLTGQLTTLSPLVIEGRVMAVRSQSERWHFVDFAGTSGTVTLMVPRTEAPPQVGDWLTVRGRLAASPARYHGGLEVFLNGRILGRARQPAQGAQVLERRHTPVPLAAFLARGQGRIVAICTEIGARDAENACLAAGFDPPWQIVTGSFGSRAEMIRQIERLGRSEECAGLAVLRGGGDARSMEMWNDPEVVRALLAAARPFYTALGHSTYVLLADRYADEAFDTPSAFGAVVGQVLAQLGRMAGQHAALSSELDRAQGALNATNARLQSARAQRALLAIVAAALLMALIAVSMR